VDVGEGPVVDRELAELQAGLLADPLERLPEGPEAERDRD
jgi:hypothetical protein